MTLKQLLDKKAELKKQRKAELDKATEANGHAFDKDAVAKIDAEVDNIDSLILAAQKDIEAEAKGPVATLGQEPAPLAPQASNREVRQAINNGQLDIGNVRDMLSRGRMQNMASQIVLENPTHGFHTFGSFLQAVRVAGTSKMRTVDPRLQKLATIAGNSESSDTDGGFLAPPEFMAPMLGNLIESGIVAPLCTRMPVTGPSVMMPRLKEQSRATGSRYGGVRAYWIGEGDSITTSKLAFERKNEQVHKLAALVPVTDELMADAAFFGAWVEIASRAEMAFTLDDSLIRGGGTANPLGVLNAACLVSQAAESGQDVDTVIRKNIHKMIARVDSRSKRNAKWFYNQELYSQLLELKDEAGRLIFTPGMMINNQPIDLLVGKQAIELEQCSAPGDVGDIILADWSQYLLLDRSGPEVATSMHFYFDTDQQAMRIIQRVGGCPLPSAALTPFKGSNTLSPFVTLAAR